MTGVLADCRSRDYHVAASWLPWETGGVVTMEESDWSAAERSVAWSVATVPNVLSSP